MSAFVTSALSFPSHQRFPPAQTRPRSSCRTPCVLHYRRPRMSVADEEEGVKIRTDANVLDEGPMTPSATLEAGEPDVSMTDSPKEKLHKRLRSALGLVWAGFVGYAWIVPPAVDATSSDTYLHLLRGDVYNVNQLFVTIFFILGNIAVTSAMLLNAGASRQRKWLPMSLFTTGSLFLGFFALGPYLAARQYAPRVARGEVNERGIISRLLESRILAGLIVASNMAAYAWGLGLFFPGSETWHDLTFFSSIIDLVRTAGMDKAVSLTCVDLLLLSVTLWDPLTEDMQRRGWFRKDNKGESLLTALMILSTPALGPSIYVLCRDALPDAVSAQAGGDAKKVS